MRDEVMSVVDRLRQTLALPWLRIIDDAGLDRPAAPEQTPEVVVAPYRWLIERVGNGLRLTQAGYLPPAFVAEAMTALGWQNQWRGRRSREDQTIPLLDLRESAQRFGLLRKNKGQLLVTKAGRELAADPAALWWHLAERLPDGRSEPERDAGVLYLLTVAAGRARDDELLAQGLSLLGWSERGAYEPLSPSAASLAAYDTWALFDRLGLLPKRVRWDAPGLPPSDQARRLASAALIGRTAKQTPAARTNEPTVQLLITLRDVEPPIWRRLVVPASLTLHELHAVIQTAMGWADYHLHLFEVAGVRYGDVEDFDGPLGDEDSFTVGQAAAAVQMFSYEYDFGDGWTHDIAIEQRAVGADTPQLVDGRRACPPEDSGGPGGYQRLLAILSDPGHPEYSHALHWVGGSFDPDAFDLAGTNADVELVDRQTRRR